MAWGARLSSAALAASILLGSRVAGATDYVSDPLTDPNFSGRGFQGGSFSANGWTVQNGTDAVWYEIADALESGRVEYTITGLSLQTSLTGGDQDLFTMYQAPTGLAEPIAYIPGFRNNDFKVFTRIFGALDPSRPGSMKLELAFCPRGDPWYHDEVCLAACDGSGLAYANGSQNDVGWDANASYRMAVEWGNGQMTFYRDQAALGTVGYPGVWAPQPLRVRLGSPRHGDVASGNFMPIGATIKDVLIQGTAGSMTPVCSATVSDAGAPDGGSAGSGGQSGDWQALADVTAASWEPGVYSVVSDLNVEADANFQPTAVVYLRFPPISGNIQTAVLRLHTSSDPSAAGGSGVPCVVNDDTWSEDTMTWATRPAVSTTCAGTATSVDPDQDIEWDVTALVASNQSIDLAIVSQDSNGAHYMSKEAGDATKSPHLLAVVTPGTTPDGGTAGGGGSGGTGWSDSGIPIDASSGGHSGAQGGTDQADSGGCGCRMASGSASGVSALGLALLGALARRRRRRRAQQL